MAELKWNDQGLTDSQLSARLCGLHPESQYREVYLYNNKLQTMPQLNTYKQFKGLQRLSLLNNWITTLDPQTLPLDLRVLFVNNNNITEVGDLSKHHQLDTLMLSHNNITGIDGHRLPLSLNHLDMSHNNITEVGDLSQHHKLDRLDLRHNHITGIDGHRLPLRLGQLDMSDNNITEVEDLSGQQLVRLKLCGNDIISIHPSNTNLSDWIMDTLGEKFFQTETGYNHLCKFRFNPVWLKQPPREVFKQGLKSVLSFYKDMRLSKQVRNSRKRLVLLGPTEAGKTSMVESLTSGKAVLVNIRDRTQVINIKYWDITEDDIIHIYDHGGHMIYNITSPFFISKESTIFLVHDVCKVDHKEVDQTIGILRQALHQYPENVMYLILTHSDLLNVDELDSNGKAITKAIQLFLGEEINSLRKLLWKKQSANEDQVLIDATQKLLDLFNQKRTTMPCYKVSSENYVGMKEVKRVLVQMSRQKRDPVPESWVEFYKAILDNKKQYLRLNEILALFQSNTQRSESDTSVAFSDLTNSDLDENTIVQDNLSKTDDFAGSVPLQYFADTNLVLHYSDNPFLKDYVFHDSDFLVELMKSLFHHNISEVVNYESDEQLQLKFKRVECDVAVKRYQNEGLLSRKLLSYLWDKHGLRLEDENVLLELLHVINICYDITKDEKDNLQYFPWFVQSQKCPPNVNRNHLMTFDKEHASVHFQCEFFNRLPLNVFEMVCVCLQRKATKESHYVGDRHAWRDGLQISFGSVECVLMRSPENSAIDICLRGKLEDIPDIWKATDSLLENLMSVLQPYQGIIKSVHFICGHCDILGISPPNCWLPDHVFPRGNKKVPKFIQCPKGGGAKDIPSALIVAIFKDGESKEEQTAALTDVAEYLQSNWKPKTPPKELLFLDCEQIEHNMYTLTWAVPNVEAGGDPISHVIIEMKGRTDHWQPCQGPVIGNTFAYFGSAEEFRVTTQNKYGMANFSHCVPAFDILDEHLLHSDLEDMNHNMETFCQMSCVEKITLRLISRGVISQTAQERINRCSKASEGARIIIEEVRRRTYRQLFLFKKTLEEFDQPTLAALVKVRKRNEIESDEECHDRQNHEVPQPPPGNTLHVQIIPNCDDISIMVYSRETLLSQKMSDTGVYSTDTIRGGKRETPADCHDDEVLDLQRFKSQAPQQSHQEQPTPSLIAQPPYHLLEELTTEQRTSFPKERLFVTIVHFVQNVRVFGINLGFKLKQVKNFQSDNPSSVQDQVIEMLDVWRRKKKVPATVERLIVALQKSKIPEQSYRQDVLDYFNQSDDSIDTEDSSEDY